jgi:hypothetical protein
MAQFHENDCGCDACLVRRVEEALAGAGPIETVLLVAWSFAAEDLGLWATGLWPLIVRVETAHRDGDVDGYAEDELRAAVHRWPR